METRIDPEDIKKVKTTKDKSKGIDIRNVTIDKSIIASLSLDKHSKRSIRRLIAKREKVPWNVYKIMWAEVLRRILNNLNLETGKEEI